MSKKYIIPLELRPHFEEDPILKQIKDEGESKKMPEINFYQACCAYLLDQRRFLFIELGRYLQAHGPLQPLEENGLDSNTLPQDEKKDFPPLKVITAEEPEPERFRKVYE